MVGSSSNCDEIIIFDKENFTAEAIGIKYRPRRKSRNLSSGRESKQRL